jgi:hypothetical protein
MLPACFVTLALAQEVIFTENFENGLKNWKITDEKVEIVTSKEYGKCVRISKTNRRGFTHITHKFPARRGKYTFHAMIQSENVVPGEKRYECGKFQAVVYDNRGRKTDYYPGDDFEGTFGWSPRKFEALDFEGTETLELRIGLQNAKGAVYVDQIEVLYEQE